MAHSVESPVTIAFGEISVTRASVKSWHLGVTLLREVAERIRTGSERQRTHFTHVAGAAGSDFLFMTGSPRPDTADSYNLSGRNFTTVLPSFRQGEIAGDSIPVAYITGEQVDGVVMSRMGDFAIRLGQAVLSVGVTAEQLGAAVLLAECYVKPKLADGLHAIVEPFVSPDVIAQAFPELATLNPPVIIQPPLA